MIYHFILGIAKIACIKMVKSSTSTTKSALVDSSNTEVTQGVADFKIIKVSPETHKELQNLGTKGETFDDVIKRLINEYKERHG